MGLMVSSRQLLRSWALSRRGSRAGIMGGSRQWLRYSDIEGELWCLLDGSMRESGFTVWNSPALYWGTS